MIILKFGGTSMGTAARIKEVAILAQREDPVVVVLSAMAGVTDMLIGSLKSFRTGDRLKGSGILQQIRSRMELEAIELFNDMKALESVLGYLDSAFNELVQSVAGDISQEIARWFIVQGEMITSRLFAEYLQACGVKARLLNAPGFMRLNEQGEPDLELISSLLLPQIEKEGQQLFVTQGFVCRNHTGEIDNLQRGGSDYSATLIGAAVKAEVIEIWTDIDGMQNNDPREVEDTFAIRSLSFDEAAELAYFGAKILHPACVWPAQQFNIPIWLRHTMQPENHGTLIRGEGERHQITAIAAKDHITAIRIKSGRMLNTYGFLVSVFKVFEDFQTPIDMITTSEVSVSLTIDNDSRLDGIVAGLWKLGKVEVDPAQSIICVVGDFLADEYGHVARILNTLQHIPVRMISYGGSQNNITILVPTRDKKRALNRLNSGLFNIETLTSIPDYACS